MSQIVSARVADELAADLARLAAARGVPVGTFVAQALAEVVADPPGPAEPGACETTVVNLLGGAGEGTEAAVRAEMALALARTIDAGGSGAPAAAGRLAELVKAGTAEAESDLHRLVDHLSTPVYTQCPQCGRPL
jgi:hypothetical protein